MAAGISIPVRGRAASAAIQPAAVSGATLAADSEVIPAAAADIAATGTVADVTVETDLREVFLATDLQVAIEATVMDEVTDHPYRSLAIVGRDRKAPEDFQAARNETTASRRELTAVGRNPMAEARALEPRAIGARRKTDTIGI